MNSVSSTGPESIVHPLEEFYVRSGLPLPPMNLVEPQEMPEPYRSLLVHEGDMTSTLENFHRSRIRIEVLRREQRNQIYSREVVLRLEEKGKPVEFGAIKMDLALFPAAARDLVLAETWPLGRVLKECGVSYVSRPKAFLRIASDHLINHVLGMTGAHVLYGRRNTLLDQPGRILADIVEILPAETN